MKYLFNRIRLLFILLLLGSCIEPFSPPEVASAKSYLVVDGYLNVANQPSRIKLSRTQPISQAFTPQPELRAKLLVEGSLGSTFQFQEEGNGNYLLDQQRQLSGRAFCHSSRYKLDIPLQGYLLTSQLS